MRMHDHMVIFKHTPRDLEVELIVGAESPNGVQ